MPDEIVFCDPFYRADAYVRAADIPVALEYFAGKLGQKATRIFLCEKVKVAIESIIPDGVEVIVDNSVSAWEVRAEIPNTKIINQDTSLKVLDRALNAPEPCYSVNIQGNHQEKENNKILSITERDTASSNDVVVEGVTGTGEYRVNSMQALMPITVDARIIELFNRGKIKRDKSCRNIARLLQQEGYKISPASVNRRINNYLRNKKKEVAL